MPQSKKKDGKNMAEEISTSTTENPVEQPKPQPPHGEEHKDTTDWKAEARKWETRAKENKSAAEELEAMKQSQMTDQQKMQAKVDRQQKELDALKAEKQQNSWRNQVSKDTGIPANVLRGSTLEEIQAHAESLKSLITTKPHAAIAFGVDKQPNNPAANNNDWLREAFKRK